MIEKNNKNFQRRDKEVQELLELVTQEGLHYVSVFEDTENFTKTMTFLYKQVLIEVSVRFSSMRYPVIVTGQKGDLLFESLPNGMSRTTEGIRVGLKGKGYPRTKEHVLDQIRIFKLEIDKRVNNSTLFS